MPRVIDDPTHCELEREVERLSGRVAELEQQNAALAAFSSLAAHELTEPLILTEAYSTMAAERLAEDAYADVRRDLEVLARTAVRTRHLVDAILSDARWRDRPLEYERVDTQKLVRDCLEMLTPEISARDAMVNVGPLPAVWGEPALLSSLFSNLLVNALKYGARRQAIVVRAVKQGHQCLFVVESDGPPITPEDRTRIFNSFERATGERRARGAGLGLAICRRIVERHGGELGTTATNGSGNSFYFTLLTP